MQPIAHLHPKLIWACHAFSPFLPWSVSRRSPVEFSARGLFTIHRKISKTMPVCRVNRRDTETGALSPPGHSRTLALLFNKDARLRLKSTRTRIPQSLAHREGGHLPNIRSHHVTLLSDHPEIKYSLHATAEQLFIICLLRYRTELLFIICLLRYRTKMIPQVIPIRTLSQRRRRHPSEISIRGG